MGKIIIEFSLNTVINKKGVDFDTLSLIVKSLQGKTELTSIIIFNANILTVEAENDNFLDGTQIVGNWRRVTQTVNGVPKFIDVFNGITIIDPPHVSVTIPSASNYNYQIYRGSSTTSPAVPATNAAGNTAYPPGSHPGTSATFSPSASGVGSNGYNKYVTLDNYKTSGRDAEFCVCGAEKAGGLHSDWCNKKN